MPRPHIDGISPERQAFRADFENYHMSGKSGSFLVIGFVFIDFGIDGGDGFVDAFDGFKVPNNSRLVGESTQNQNRGMRQKLEEKDRGRRSDRCRSVDLNFLAGLGGAVHTIQHFLHGEPGFAGGFQWCALGATVHPIAELADKQRREIGFRADVRGG
jgi:hypothetical protein